MTNNQTSTPPKDALLRAGKFMTIALQMIIGIVLVVLMLALPVVLFHTGEVAVALAENGSDASLTTVLITIATFIIGSTAIIALGFHFFRLLGRIIDTVGAGEPFVEINADRLSRMGWIALIFQIASFPLGGLAAYLTAQFPNENITSDIEFSLTGLLFAIVLFILARVFKQGATMRDDLEGTV